MLYFPNSPAEELGSLRTATQVLAVLSTPIAHISSLLTLPSTPVVRTAVNLSVSVPAVDPSLPVSPSELQFLMSSLTSIYLLTPVARCVQSLPWLPIWRS